MPIWSPEHVVTAEWAVELIERQFPALAPAAAEPIGEGFDNTVYRVNGTYVFRFPRRESAVELLRAECALLPALAALEQPLAIPAPLLLGAAEGRYPWPFAGYRYVPGRSLRAGDRAGRLASVEPLAVFVKALHAFPVEAAKQLGVPGCDPIGRFELPVVLDKLRANADAAAALGLWHGGEALERMIAGLNGVQTAQFRPTLLHGDLHIRNVLAGADGKLTGVIDWGDTHIGNPAQDLAIVYSYVPPEARGRFWDIYGMVDDDTRRLAQFRAVYTLLVLLLYGHDLLDGGLTGAAQEGLELALRDPL